jgi:DNA-binding SARP family transcriptional activator/TolB-like protein
MIHLRTLGAAELRGPDGEPLDAVLAQPKRFALLFYLATAGDGFQRRDTLFDLFWRNADQSQARAALNQSIYFLRRELGRDAILSRGNDEVAVQPSLVWCDVAAFDAALAVGDRGAALDLYGGELLPGFFLSDAPGWERWLDGERDRLRARAAAAARELADEALAGGEAADAAEWARRAVEIVPYDEMQLRRLLALLARLGDRAGAVKAYEEAAARFAADYEGELSETTRGLIERILAGEVEEEGLAEAWPVAAQDGGRVARAAEVVHTEVVGDTELVGEPEPVADTDRSHAEARPFGALRGRWSIAALIVGALLGAGILQLMDADAAGSDELHTDAGAPPARPVATSRLAVLPLSGGALDREHVHLPQAITDGLIRRLSDLAGLGVTASMSVAPFRDARPSAPEIGETLGVKYLLEGSIEPAGEAVRLDVRLIEAESGRALWSNRYEASPEDVPALEGDVAVAVARALSVDMGADERARLRDPGTDDPIARHAYLEGRYLLGKSDEASFHEALSRFRAALDRDPTYALAWSGLSDAYDHLAGIGAMASRDAYSRARSAAQRALEIDPDLAEAHSSLAMALSHQYWMSEDAERHWRRALELKPSDARSRRTYAGHLRNMGRFEEARAHAILARDLDPLPFYSHFELLVIPYFQGRYEEVVELAARLAATDPGYSYAHFLRALALVQLDRADDALAALDAVDPQGTFTDARLIRGYIAGRRGDEAAARAELRRFEQMAQPAARGFERAILHLALDEHDLALATLEEAYDAAQFRLRLLGYEPLFDPLRGDRRFEELLGRIGVGG